MCIVVMPSFCPHFRVDLPYGPVQMVKWSNPKLGMDLPRYSVVVFSIYYYYQEWKITVKFETTVITLRFV